MTKRRLAAIMFTDVVGYTAMMEKDENAAMEVLDAHRRDLEELSEKYDAELVQYFGDGSLNLFPSVLDAVGCALELQQRLTRDGFVPLRIGVHIGEVLIQDGGKVFGDGVNVASRVESTGHDGTVLLSQQAYDKVKNQPDLQFQDLGEFSFKNVAAPMRLYGLVDEGLPKIDLKKLNLSKAKRITRTRTWFYAAVVLLVIAAIAAGVAYLMQNDTPEVTVQEASGELQRIAVFPFEIQGSDDMTYLENGLVDIFSTKIDGVAGFSAVDPNITIGYAKKRGGQLTTPAEFAQAAKGLGAGEFILGNVITLGEDIRLKVAQYNSSGKLELTEDILVRGIDGILEGVDILIRRTVASKLDESGRDITAAQTMFTSDIEALRYFLEGEERRRLGHYAEAGQLYQQALSRDSTMALTWLNLSQVCTWSQECGIPIKQSIRNAEKYSSRLPEKYREYIEVTADWRLSRADDIEAQVRNLIEKYGESTELLTLLGNVILTHHTVNERPVTDALPYFRKAFEYDPGNTDALNNLIRLLSYQRDTAELLEIVEKVPRSSSAWMFARSAYLVARDRDWSQEDLIEVFEHPMFDIELIFTMVRNDRILDRFGRFFEELQELNGEGFTGIKAPHQFINVAHFGKMIGVEEMFSDPFHADMYKYVMPLAFIGMGLDSQYSHFYKSKSLLQSGNISYWPDDFQLAVIAVYEQDQAAFKRHLRVLEELSGDDGKYFQEIKVARGYWLHRQGEYSRSNEALDSALAVRPTFTRQAAFVENTILLLKAENYFNLGDMDKALLYYTLLTDILGPGDETKVGFSWLRRGEILSELGRNEEALQFLNYFLEMYSDCDPIFDPWVEKAEAERNEVLSRIN